MYRYKIEVYDSLHVDDLQKIRDILHSFDDSAYIYNLTVSYCIKIYICSKKRFNAEVLDVLSTLFLKKSLSFRIGRLYFGLIWI